MILPRRLMTLADGKFCEADDPLQAMNYRPKGFVIPDAEAERIGLKAYLDATGWGDVAGDKRMTEARAIRQVEAEHKAVEQVTTEDKSASEPVAVEAPVAETPQAEKPEEPGPGLHIDAESRRGRRS